MTNPNIFCDLFFWQAKKVFPLGPWFFIREGSLVVCAVNAYPATAHVSHAEAALNWRWVTKAPITLATIRDIDPHSQVAAAICSVWLVIISLIGGIVF